MRTIYFQRAELTALSLRRDQVHLRSELTLQNRACTSGAIQKGVPTEVFLRSRVFVS